MKRGLRRVMGLGLSLALLLAGPSVLASFDLGPAANYAVYQMGASATDLGQWTSSGITINGNVGYLDTSPGGNTDTLVNGNVDGNSTAAPKWTINGTRTPAYLQVLQSTLLGYTATARSFSQTAAGYTTPNAGDISGTTTINFNSTYQAIPGTYIVTVGALALSGGATLTLNGSALPAGSRVIVNVTDSFALSGASKIQGIGGLDTSHVLINYTSTTHDAGISGGSTLDGTFLAPYRTVNFNQANTVIDGSVIAYRVNFSSGLTINGTPFVPEPSTYMAATLLLLPAAASTLRCLRRKQ